MSPVTRSSRYKTRYSCEDSDSSLQVDENDSNTSDDFEDHADPQYRAYLDYLRIKENAYGLEIPDDNGEVELVVYESPEQEIKRRPKNLEKVNKKTVTIGVKKDSRKRLRRNVQIKDKTEELEDSRYVLRSTSNLKVQTKDKILEPKSLRGENVNCASQGADMDETGEKSNTENIVKDTWYMHFCNNIHMEGDCVVYVYGNGKRVIYEEDDDMDDGELSSDIEIFENDPVLESGKMENFPSETPQFYISPMEGDDLQWIPNPVRNSKFKENLIENLKVSYDQEEYDDLWHRVNEKKTSDEKSRRKGNRKVIKDGFGKSYLECYKDLEAQLLSVQYERPIRLNILRGFFYWLQNSSDDGAFRPWEDPLCLAVMPGSK